MNSPNRTRRTPGYTAGPAVAVRGGAGTTRPGSTRGPAPAPASPKRAPLSPPGSPGPVRNSSAAGGLGRGNSWAENSEGNGSPSISRVSSYSDCGRKDTRTMKEPQDGGPGLFHIIQQLAAAENALWNILDGLKSNTTHASFFCREYWGSSGSQAQLSLEKLSCNERLKRQVQQACVLESLSLGVASHLCSGVMQGISVTIRSRLRNLLYYIHENCLVLLDMVCQRWMLENQNNWQEQPEKSGHCPENLNLDVLVRVKRYRRLRRGEHVMALRQHNEMIVNVVRQLCRGAAPKRPPLSSRGAHSPGGDRSPGGVRGTMTGPGGAPNVLSIVNDVLTARQPLDRLRASVIRSKMLQYMCFKPLLNIDGADPDCPWPREDPYDRYGADQFAADGSLIWFEPLPPMLPNLEQNPKLPPPPSHDTYTLVLDLDETLVHYFELDGMGNYDIRPGMHEFLERMNQLGYEIVIFTAATQDYADWVIDQIDPGRLIHHRLYRQHALPWGPIFVKDMSKLGRDLDRTLIIDNVQENFMLQPHNGIFIVTWYDDPHDTALFALTPLLDELIVSRAKVSEILDKYRDQIPTWAGFDQFSQLGGEYSDYEQYDDGQPLDQPVEPQPAPAAREQQLPPQPPQPQPQTIMPQTIMPQKAPQQEYQQEYDMPSQQEERAAIPSPPAPAPAPAPFTSPDASAGAARYAAAPSATSPYSGGYQTSLGVTTYMTQRPMGGYPQQQMQAQAPPEPQKQQPRAQPVPVHQGQPQLMQSQPQLMQPQMQMSAPRPQAAPAFASGFGPCQAPPPQAAALAQGVPRPMFAGVGGPFQAPRPGAVVSQRR